MSECAVTLMTKLAVVSLPHVFVRVQRPLLPAVPLVPEAAMMQAAPPMPAAPLMPLAQLMQQPLGVNNPARGSVHVQQPKTSIGRR